MRWRMSFLGKPVSTFPGHALALATAIALLLSHGTSTAADLLKLAIGQRGLWDSAIAEIGVGAGIFQKHNLELQTVYTSGGGETQQAVISGSVDIGVSPGMLGVLGAYAKGAPVRVIAGEATGTAEYYFVRTSSQVQKDFKGVTPNMTLAYSTNGSGTHITALRFMKEYGFQARLVATGNVPATFTSVMSGQVDIGFSTPPFGLEAAEQGQIRIVALANDLTSVRTQTVRVTSPTPMIWPSAARSTTASCAPTVRSSISCTPTRRRSRPSRNMLRSRLPWRRPCATASIPRRCCSSTRSKASTT
jgi:ABC-type nitrate/sulfonate/bicarbonate transport system substrate-binding protein